MDPIAVEKARLQFLQELKTDIRNDLETLISKYELSQRLQELEELTAEADKRQHNAFADLKDVWRPDLDIQTAIRARVSADQAPRIEALQAELAELQEQNRASEERLHGTEAQIDAVRSNVTSALEMLDKLLVSVSINAPEDEQALRAMLDALLTELGPV